MDITNNHNILNNTDTFYDPLEKAIVKYKNYPNMTCIPNLLLHFNVSQKIKLPN